MIGIGIGIRLGSGGLVDSVVQIITATVAPATSALVVGQALEDTTNWATFLNTSNYATSAGGETIDTVVVNYVGDTAAADEAFTDGETNQFSITVTDTALNARTFTTSALTVIYAAGTAPSVADGQTWTVDDTSVNIDGAASGTGLTFSYALSGSTAGVTINSGTGAITGTPSGVDSGTATITAADQYGRELTDTFTWSAALRTQATGGADLDLSFVEDSAISSTDLTTNWTENGNTLTYAITGTALPAGLSVSSAGIMTGTPTTITADATYTLRGTDEYARTTDDTFTLAITVAGDTTAPTLTTPSFDGVKTITVGSDESGTLFYLVDDNATRNETQVEAGGGLLSGSYEVELDENSDDIDVSGVVSGNHYLHLMVKDAAGNQSIVASAQYPFPGSVPATMSAPTVTATGPNSISVDLAAAPDPGSDAIDQYDIRHSTDETTWTEVLDVADPVSVTGLTASTLYYAQTRASSPAGDGAWSLSDSDTTDAAATAPAAMVDANWSVVTGAATGAQIDLTVASAPANGGSAITKYQYTTNGGTNWLDTGLTATGTIALSNQSTGSAFAAATSYDFELRAVNAVGNATGSNTESATSSAAASGSIVDSAVLQLEPTNTQFSAAQWDDEKSTGISLVDIGTPANPTLVTDASLKTAYLSFGTSGNIGLGDTDISGSGLPSGNAVRTMAIVARYASGGANYQGVLYGQATTKRAFGVAIHGSSDVARVDTWAGAADGVTAVDDDVWHTFIATYDGTNGAIYLDGVADGAATSLTPLDTSLSRFYICTGLNNGAKNGVDVAAVLIWPTALNSTDIAAVQTYLDDKYMVT